MRLVGISVLFFLVLGCSKYEQDPNDQRKFIVCNKKQQHHEVNAHLIEIDYDGEKLINGHLTVEEDWSPWETFDEFRPITTLKVLPSFSTEECLFFKNDRYSHKTLHRHTLYLGEVPVNRRDCKQKGLSLFSCEVIEFSEYQRRIDENEERHQRYKSIYDEWYEQKQKQKIPSDPQI